MGSYHETSPKDFREFETYGDNYPPASISPELLQDMYSINDHTHFSDPGGTSRATPTTVGLTPDTPHDHTHSSDPGGTSRATPTTLGWTPDTPLPKLYKFWLKKNVEPYLELLPHWEVTSQTPQRVYLDKDE